jgi:hypothetical protein
MYRDGVWLGDELGRGPKRGAVRLEPGWGWAGTASRAPQWDAPPELEKKVEPRETVRR